MRAIQGHPSPAFQLSFTESLRARKEHWRLQSSEHSTYEVLVLGAGGPNGAFGAGLLCGWTESAQRPEFDLVTGVSAGALMAPFAFLGPSRDADLRSLFKHLGPEDIYETRGAFSAFFGESLMSSAPLAARIERYVDDGLLRGIALEHAAGRRLYVGTTDFDLGRLIIWDMGAIATVGTPESLQLFRRILLASSAIPTFYPPVLFKVHGPHGELGEEMHVDGSIESPMFVPYQVLDLAAAARDAGLEAIGDSRALTVIHNGALTPPIEIVARDTLDIATRTFTLAAASMAQEDVMHLFTLSRVWDATFRFACLPDANEVSVFDFSSEDTERLFALGFTRGVSESPFQPTPPLFLASEEVQDIQPVPLTIR